MKKSVLKILSISLLASCSAVSLAGTVGWVSSAKVVKIVATVNGGINVRLSPELSGCTSQSGYGPLYASVYPTHPGIKNIEAILLAAYVADKPVGLYFDDTNCRIMEVEMGGHN